jgi:hypothetical protein
MKTLTEALKEYITVGIVNEGGNVWDNSAPIKKEYIQPTLKKFKEEFTKIFPVASKHFDSVITLGSVGKKDVSGDIDLAIDEAAFTNVNDWKLDPAYLTELFAKFKKRSRSATDSQIMKRAVIVGISEIVNKESKIIETDVKSAGSGTLFCQFPQFDENGKETNLSVQIDVNVGDLDWLRFAYYSDSYKGNVKGLHRTQLMLSLFTYKSHTFSHNYGVKDKESQEVVAKNPDEAVSLLNKLYGFNINEKILQNYFDLQDFLKKNLKEEDLHNIWNTYLKILDSTRCDIPEDLQAYWVEHQDELGLTGKFLPNNSNLLALKK